MTTYYKAVRPDGTDFFTGTVQWAPPAGHKGDWVVRHPTAEEVGRYASEYLSVSTAPTDCTGMRWPCRLLAVEAVGDVTAPSRQYTPHKRAGSAFRVTGELLAHKALGPQGEYVAALIERARRTTAGEECTLTPAWDAAWNAARIAARIAAWNAVRDDAEDDTKYNARVSAWDAARALIVRDLIAVRKYDVLTREWRTAIGPIHPDDPELPRDRNTA